VSHSCHCGCGQLTAISAYTHRGRGWVKGQPRAYVKGHNGTGRARGVDYTVTEAGHDTPCWLWQKTRNEKGYGVMVRNREYRAAHVVYYEQNVGPVPEGMEIDHRCRNRACVNPDHLEAVTHKENMVRGIVARHVPGVSELRDARVAARLSQDDVAAALSVTQPQVSAWELGRAAAPAHVLPWLRERGE
jgi:DNA-binding XRE family transcriptional regulator